MLLINPPNDIINASELIDSVLAAAMHATRAFANRSLSNNTPGSLAFHRNMMSDIPLIADLITIRNSRQAAVDESLRITNLRRLSNDYSQGERVMFRVYKPNKLDARWSGPSKIITVLATATLLFVSMHTP
jgi:hypothetical protein